MVGVIDFLFMNLPCLKSSLLYHLNGGYVDIGSYGSTMQYKSVERIKPIRKHYLLGASGEVSDFQEIVLHYLDQLILVNFSFNNCCYSLLTGYLK